MDKKGITLHQFCIDAHPVKKFVSELPTGVAVKELSWEGWEKGVWRKIEVPAYMKKNGVSSMHENSARVRAQGFFKQEGKKPVARDKIVKTMDWVSRHHRISDDGLQIARVVLSYDGEQAVFKREVKNKALANDRRRKLVVLGLASSSREGQKLLDKLMLKKIACTIIQTSKSISICTEHAAG